MERRLRSQEEDRLHNRLCWQCCAIVEHIRSIAAPSSLHVQLLVHMIAEMVLLSVIQRQCETLHAFMVPVSWQSPSHPLRDFDMETIDRSVSHIGHPEGFHRHSMPRQSSFGLGISSPSLES